MDIKVYNGEKNERGKRRYVVFALTLITIIGLSLWKKNIIGVVVLFLILGAYFYYSIISNQIISMAIKKDHLLIDKKIYPRHFFIGYSLEIEKKTQKIKNIILIQKKGVLIYTIHDKEQNLEDFLNELNNYLEIFGEYDQGSLEKLARVLKL